MPLNRGCCHREAGAFRTEVGGVLSTDGGSIQRWEVKPRGGGEGGGRVHPGVGVCLEAGGGFHVTVTVYSKVYTADLQPVVFHFT